MLSLEYLALGLTAACRAPEREGLVLNADRLPPWFSAHFGLALMAAYWLSHEFDLDERTSQAIAKQCDLVMQEFPQLFEPFEFLDGTADPDRESELTDALRPGIHRYIRAGHNVTYTAYVVKALREHPEWCTPPVMGRLLRLIEETNADFDRADAPVPTDDVAPQYGDTSDVASTMIRDIIEMEKPWEVNYGHVLTHGHGLVELEWLGYSDLAQAGFDAHRAHAHQVRSAGPRETAYDKIYKDGDPLQHVFWEGDVKTHSYWEAGHSFKYPYSFFRSAKLVANSDLIDNATLRVRKFI